MTVIQTIIKYMFVTSTTVVIIASAFASFMAQLAEVFEHGTT